MPPWGRPPGARPGRRNDRLREVPRSWDYDDRVEELDTDEDGSQGVVLDQSYDQKRFVSDELRFTGIDLGDGGVRQRRSPDAYDDDFTPSDDEDDYDTPSGLIRRRDMQAFYREKEEMLVQRALERIARARALGKANVKLTRAEIDALQRLERNQNPPRPSAAPVSAPMAAPKSRKEAPVKRKAVEVRKKPGGNDGQAASNSPRGKAVDGRSRGRSNSSSRDNRDDSAASYVLPPADQDYGHVGRALLYSQGYYVTGPRQAGSSRHGSRTNSSQSLRQQQVQQAAAYQQHPYYANRYSSNPDAVYGHGQGSHSPRAHRPDPSEPEWEPRARSTSSLVNVPLDQLPYQTSTARAPRFDPSDPRFASPPRRVTSGPATVHQREALPHPPHYRRPQDELFPPDGQPEVMRYLTHSESSYDDDSDYDEGVQVDVSERAGGEYTIQTRSASAATQKGNGGKSNGKGKKGR